MPNPSFTTTPAASQDLSTISPPHASSTPLHKTDKSSMIPLLTTPWQNSVCRKENSMPDRFPPDMLKKLRNDIPINLVITNVLKLPTKMSEGYFRFLCPICSDFNTATNPKINLARCFPCQKNFNPIDMVMTVKNVNFRNAVDYLTTILRKGIILTFLILPLPAGEGWGGGSNS